MLRAGVNARQTPETLTVPAAEPAPLARRAAAEGLGTAFLLAIVVGSGIVAERLSGGHEGFALLANSLATGTGLVALILAFGSFSGAHFNPVVTLTDVLLGGRPWREFPLYAIAQVLGALVGVGAAEVMFGTPIFELSQKPRTGLPQVFAEFVATFGLLAIVVLALRRGPTEVAVAVGTYIGAAYWFTSSTSFANPAVTLARALTNTFTGIRPSDVPGFLAGQALGTAAFVLLARWLLPRPATPLERSNNA